MSGALYAQAFLGVADLLTGASKNAAYEAAYGKYYTSYASMHNAANQKVAAEANISAITQDRINTDKIIDMQQDDAEAQAKVLAAVSGREGQSVDDVVYQTKVNSSVAKSNNLRNAEQGIEQQLANVYQSHSTLLAVDNPQVYKPNMGLGIMEKLAPVVAANGDMFVEGFNSMTTSGDTGLDGMLIDTPVGGDIMLPTA